MESVSLRLAPCYCGHRASVALVLRRVQRTTSPNADGTKVLCDTNHPDLGIHLIDVGSGEREFICDSGATNQGSQWKTSRYALAEDFAAARSAAKSSGNLSWMEAATDTVYGPQWTHPHPSWSPDEGRIAFGSDRTGVTQVYVCDLD